MPRKNKNAVDQARLLEARVSTAPSAPAARLKRRRRRKESLIRALFQRRFETPHVVSYGNESFLNGLPGIRDEMKVCLESGLSSIKIVTRKSKTRLNNYYENYDI